MQEPPPTDTIPSHPLLSKALIAARIPAIGECCPIWWNVVPRASRFRSIFSTFFATSVCDYYWTSGGKTLGRKMPYWGHFDSSKALPFVSQDHPTIAVRRCWCIQDHRIGPVGWDASCSDLGRLSRGMCLDWWWTLTLVNLDIFCAYQPLYQDGWYQLWCVMCAPPA